MLRTLPVAPVMALVALSAQGCKQYYTVDDACVESERVPAGSFLGPTERAAMLRINCYRRLTGLSMGSANELVQVAADGEVNYVAENPDLENFAGMLAEQEWLTQRADAPGFTGVSARERLTDLEHGAGYSFYDEGTTDWWEYIRVELNTPEAPAPTGTAAIELLMRDPEFRQVALQPSWIEGAYAEIELTSQWFEDGGWAQKTTDPPPTGGRAYYLLVLYTAPHLEHTNKPVFLPKPDQTGVPLYALSQNMNGTPDVLGRYPTVQLSYPITFLVGALDPEHFDEVNENQYNAQVRTASIIGPDGPLETEVLHPGDEPEDIWPSAYFQRSIVALYASEPFLPSTKYSVQAELSHPEGDFEIEYEFTTRSKDPGVDPAMGRTTPQMPTARRAARP